MEGLPDEDRAFPVGAAGEGRVRPPGGQSALHIRAALQVPQAFEEPPQHLHR